jgi:hypothetical protein
MRTLSVQRVVWIAQSTPVGHALAITLNGRLLVFRHTGRDEYKLTSCSAEMVEYSGLRIARLDIDEYQRRPKD